MKTTTKIVTGLASVAVLAVVGSACQSNSSSTTAGTTPTASSSAKAVTETTASAQAAPASSKPAAADTVTYAVTGSTADVTYGPAGSDSQGSVPMSKTDKVPADKPAYYAITAQLQGSGSVSCSIKINDKVLATSTANGGYNIAQCEISENPLTGSWENDQ
jgi:hypothetical protein